MPQRSFLGIGVRLIGLLAGAVFGMQYGNLDPQGSASALVGIGGAWLIALGAIGGEGLGLDRRAASDGATAATTPGGRTRADRWRRRNGGGD
jgi:peptidoglycan/LPS O-acetylase OafA/YrhL